MNKRPTWKPLEAKAAAFETITLPTSPQRNNPENYSGQGRDQDGAEANSPTATRPVSGEQEEIEGSSEGGGFPDVLGHEPHEGSNSVKVTPVTSASHTQTEVVTLAEDTSLSQWQTLEQSTTRSQSSKEEETAEEARGEILYIHRPTHIFSSADFQRGEEGSNPVFAPAVEKQSEGIVLKELSDSTPESLMEVLTTFVMTTVEHLPTRDSHDVDPTTTATTTATTIATTEKSPPEALTDEPSISISWVRADSEETSPTGLQQHLSPTPAATERTPATTVVAWASTLAPNSDPAVTEMESRSTVTESFVVGSQWTPVKGVSPKSEEPKSSPTTEDKDTHNPFGILVPNWTFGLIPSGM